MLLYLTGYICTLYSNNLGKYLWIFNRGTHGCIFTVNSFFGGWKTFTDIWSATIMHVVRYLRSNFLNHGGLGGSMSWSLDIAAHEYKPVTNTAWVLAQLCNLQKGSIWLAAAGDKVYQLLAHGRRFSPGTPASSITKNWSPWYSWNTAESGVKTQFNQSINQSQAMKCIELRTTTLLCI